MSGFADQVRDFVINHSDTLFHPLVVGGASAALIFLIISNVTQGIGIYKVCSLAHITGSRKFALVTMTVLLPLGVGLAMFYISLYKEREHRKNKCSCS